MKDTAHKIKINYDHMKRICLSDTEEFEVLGVTTQTKHGPLIYIDNGSNVLGVAHLDSVQDTKHFYHLEIDGHNIVYNAQLDDRLGAYVLLSLLPSLGIETDILLTFGEETGNSTAQFFKTSKKYNWMFQFDRHGDDVAMYMYKGNKFLEDRLKKSGFKTLVNGSFTDICYLEEIGCAGFNVACGYKDEHSIWASASMEMLVGQVEKFQKFFHKYKNLRINHEPKPKYTSGFHYPRYNFDEWDEWYDTKYPVNQHTALPAPKNDKSKKHDYTCWLNGDIYGVSNFRKNILYIRKGEEKDADYVLKECKMCSRRLIFTDMRSDLPGVCEMCDADTYCCELCMKLFSQKGEPILHIYCPDCRDKKNLTNAMTGHVCSVCTGSLLESEVAEGVCIYCKNHSHHLTGSG